MEVTPEGLPRFFELTLPHLNEKQRRVVAGAASEMLGHGGKSQVAVASGMSRNTVIKAEGEVVAGIAPSVRQRPMVGGDKLAEVKQPGLLKALDSSRAPTDSRRSDVVLALDLEVHRATCERTGTSGLQDHRRHGRVAS